MKQGNFSLWPTKVKVNVTEIKKNDIEFFQCSQKLQLFIVNFISKPW